MHKHTLLLAMAVCCAFAGVAHGRILVSETFTHSDGNLVGQSPETGGTWAAHSGAGAMPVQVFGGKAVLSQGSGSREDVNVAFDGGTVMGSGDVFYAAFDLTVTEPGAPIAAVYFAHFLQGTSAFDARIWVAAPTASGYRLALSNDNSITDGDGEVFTSDLAFGQTYRVVSSYDFTGQSARLWINPTDSSSPSITATDPGYSNAAAMYAFRQASGNTMQTIHNLVVGESFADVPEPLSLGFVMFAGLAGLRRRRD